MLKSLCTPLTTLILSLPILFCPRVLAQDLTLNGIAHVAIRVHDLPATQSFYEKLGFEHAFELKNKDGVVYETFIKLNDKQFLELYSPTEKDPTPAFLHLCFEGADLNALHDSYVARGLTPISVRKAGAGNLLFTLPGPPQPAAPPNSVAQNIEYTQYLPGSLHSADAGQHLGPHRIADRLTSVALSMLDPEAARTFYLDQLHFLPVANSKTLLALPGSSGQTVEIAPASLGQRAEITLQTASLKEAAQQLKQAGILPKPTPHTLAVSDPDGNLILIQDTPTHPPHTP